MSETKGGRYHVNILPNQSHRDRDGKTALILACFMGAAGQCGLTAFVWCGAGVLLGRVSVRLSIWVHAWVPRCVSISKGLSHDLTPWKVWNKPLTPAACICEQWSYLSVIPHETTSGIANNLMRYGADPNLKDFEKGMTALHYGRSLLPCACEWIGYLQSTDMAWWIFVVRFKMWVTWQLLRPHMHFLICCPYLSVENTSGCTLSKQTCIHELVDTNGNK